MFDVPPDPIAFQLGPLAIGWYGLMYALGLAVVYVVLVWLAKRAGEDPDVANNGILIVAVAALIGGRLYHVIDEWERYAADPLRIILPPYSGLGVYGGIVTGTLAAFWYARRRGAPFARWADIVAPTLFLMQAIGRWGNYFNQELYGPPGGVRMRGRTRDGPVPSALPVRVPVGDRRGGVPRLARVPAPRPACAG
jgi:phosphatidylglycerol:prolipoprotein diacylglycerol transferase